VARKAAETLMKAAGVKVPARKRAK
jgi:hypothetical protein